MTRMKRLRKFYLDHYDVVIAVSGTACLMSCVALVAIKSIERGETIARVGHQIDEGGALHVLIQKMNGKEESWSRILDK